MLIKEQGQCSALSILSNFVVSLLDMFVHDCTVHEAIECDNRHMLLMVSVKPNHYYRIIAFDIFPHYNLSEKVLQHLILTGSSKMISLSQFGRAVECYIMCQVASHLLFTACPISYGDNLLIGEPMFPICDGNPMRGAEVRLMQYQNKSTHGERGCIVPEKRSINTQPNLSANFNFQFQTKKTLNPHLICKDIS